MNNETPPTYIPCRTEILNPETDWARTWRLARLKGLNSSQTSFLWRLLHRLLPTLDRVNRITPNTSPICKLCPDQTVEDLSHALLSCSYNGVVSTALMNTLSILQPNISKSEVLTLHFDVDKQTELPVVWLTCNVLHKIWDSRKEKKKCDLVRVRADLEAKVSLLRETRHKESAEIISKMLSKS